METCSENTFSELVEDGCGRQTLRREKVNREAKEEENKSGKREVEVERERVGNNSKRICPDRLSSPALCDEPFDVFSDVEVECVGVLWDVSLCVCVCFASCCDCFFLDCACGVTLLLGLGLCICSAADFLCPENAMRVWLWSVRRR